MYPKFKILDLKNGQYVLSITANCDIVNSPNGQSFDSYELACQYLSESQMNCIRSNRFLDLSRFSIQEFRYVLYNNVVQVSNIEKHIIKTPDDQFSLNSVRAILSEAVRSGFKVILPELLTFILSYDKYKPILSEIVPPHMIQCIDEFMNDGILSCDIDILGVISLTATEKQLIMYDIEGLFRRRT